ncbi:MAG: hypothetical protein ABJA37_01135 [Ferruginibacter sp.]
MNILKLAFELFIIYLVYKLIFEFIIPVYNTTKQMKGKMHEMHQKMQEQQQSNTNNFNTAPPDAASKRPASGDYIDYEEVK